MMILVVCLEKRRSSSSTTNTTNSIYIFILTPLPFFFSSLASSRNFTHTTLQAEGPMRALRSATLCQVSRPDASSAKRNRGAPR